MDIEDKMIVISLMIYSDENHDSYIDGHEGTFHHTRDHLEWDIPAITNGLLFSGFYQ